MVLSGNIYKKVYFLPCGWCKMQNLRIFFFSRKKKRRKKERKKEKERKQKERKKRERKRKKEKEKERKKEYQGILVALYEQRKQNKTKKTHSEIKNNVTSPEFLQKPENRCSNQGFNLEHFKNTDFFLFHIFFFYSRPLEIK